MDFYFTRQTQLYNFESIDRPTTVPPLHHGINWNNWAIELQHEKRLNIWTWQQFERERVGSVGSGLRKFRRISAHAYYHITAI